MAALALSMGLTMAGARTVHADNAQMVDLPKGINADQNKIPGQYAFSAKVEPGVSKINPFGATNADWYTSSTHT